MAVLEKYPYAIVLRFERPCGLLVNHKLQGVSYEYASVLCEAGLPLKKNPADPTSENLMETFSGPQSLANAGVTFEEILGATLSAAIVANDALTVEIATAKAELATAQARIAELEAQIAAQAAQVPV